MCLGDVLFAVFFVRTWLIIVAMNMVRVRCNLHWTQVPSWLHQLRTWLRAYFATASKVHDVHDTLRCTSSRILSVHPHNLAADTVVSLHCEVPDTTIVLHTWNHLIPVNCFIGSILFRSITSNMADMRAFLHSTPQSQKLIVATGGCEELSYTGYEDSRQIIKINGRSGIFRLAHELDTTITVCLASPSSYVLYPAGER